MFNATVPTALTGGITFSSSLMHRNGAAASIQGGRTPDLAALRIAVIAHRTDTQPGLGGKHSQAAAIATRITAVSAAPFSTFLISGSGP
jgi:hypothetical protein